MDLKTKVAATFLGLVVLTLIIGLITIFIIEPTAMLPVVVVGVFVLVCWAAATVTDYYTDKRYNK